MRCGACLALAAVAVVAGCGGSGQGRLSKNAYEEQLRSALARPLPVTHSATAGAVDSLGVVATRFGDVAERLSKIEAPADVQALNDRLVAGAEKTSAGLQALVRRLRSATPARRNELLAEFDAEHMPGLDQFDRAVAALAAKGYRLRPNGDT